jgi:hypothetical protein
VKRCRLLIQLASLLVPARQRAEWSREWLAELQHVSSLGARNTARLIRFARGAFHDALWLCRGAWTPDKLAVRCGSAAWCLLGISAAILLITVVSGFLPVARSILRPLPYRDPNRIATVSDGGALATRLAIRPETVRLWQDRSKLLEGAEAYLWKQGVATDSSGRRSRLLSAQVSDNFFFLLGARSSDGRAFERNQFASCGDCVIVSYRFWQAALNAKRLTPETGVLLEGRRYRVAGVLKKDFWFLSREISVWLVEPLSSFEGERTGVVVRVRPDVTHGEAEQEMDSLVREANGGLRGTGFVRIAPVSDRVRSVFGSFGLALILAIVTAAGSSRLRFCRMNLRGALFLVAKTLLLLTAVFLTGVEFTHAALINMLGGADLATEPLSTWLFLLGCMGVLLWSLRDQQARCRVCLNRLGLRTRVGCPGCLLLDWAGTELVCVEGHGMLHVPDMVSSWSRPDHWTSLDDSWRVLFEPD